MKKKIYLVCMLIVLSVTQKTTFAQTRMGSGMFNVFVQHETSLERVKYNFYTGVFGSDLQRARIMKTLNNISGAEMHQIMVNEISNQMGETFDPSHPENYTVTFDIYHGGDFWDGWDDSYVYEDADTKDLQWGDPRKFKQNRDYPDKDWCIATITSKATGAIARCRANCGNVLRPHNGVVSAPQPQQQSVQYVPTVTYQQPQQPAACNMCNTCAIVSFTANPPTIGQGNAVRLIWITTCSSVQIEGVGNNLLGSDHIDVFPTQTTRYELTTSNGLHAYVTVVVVDANQSATGVKKPDHTLRNVGIGVGIATVGYFVIKAVINGKGSHTPSGSYNNTFQGGSDGTTTTGGQGGQNTW